MDDIQRVKEAIDIVDIIGSYVELKKAGSNYKGLCPFHTEKTPSFMVNPNLQIYKCFGCGMGGDVIKFIQEYERLEFKDALEKLAQIAGIELNLNFKKHNPKIEKEKERILKANNLAKNFYHELLIKHSIGKKGRDYALKRKLNKDMILKFEIGYAPDGNVLTEFLNQKDFSTKELVKFGLSIVRNGKVIDKFRDRLMQPIFNENGDVVGFSGRYLGDSEKAPKYLNSPETLVFKKNSQLYSLFHAKEAIRRTKKVILVEGNLDVVSAHRVETENIVAPLGTAFTIEQAKILKRFADEILLCFDNDSAGFNATIRALNILEQVEIDHKVIKIEKYTDADDVIKNDLDYWNKIINNPINTLEFILQKMSDEHDLGSPDGKSSLYKKYIPILKMTKNKIQKEYFIKKLADIVGLTISDIHEDLSNKTLSKINKIKTSKQKNNTTLDFQICACICQNVLKDTEFLNYIEESLLKSVCLKFLKNDRNHNLLNLDDEERKIMENLLLFDTSKLNIKHLIKTFLNHKIKIISQKPNSIFKIKELIELKKKYI